MSVSEVFCRMVSFFRGNIPDINHFIKVHAYARAIGEGEKLPERELEVLELAAIVHDIACPLCREKYGSALPKMQQIEGIPLTRAFFKETDVDPDVLERVVFLVSHHHALKEIAGMDYQILVEADYIVNAEENHYHTEDIVKFQQKYFRTETGSRLLTELFLK